MTVLKGIPRCLPPELLYVLAQMGHGDELVLADANFPAESVAASTTLGHAIRADSLRVPALLEAVACLLPLDSVPGPGGAAAVMALMPEHAAAGMREPPVWAAYAAALARAEGAPVELARVERFAFYARAKAAFAVVATGETALYANLILKKGFLPAPEDA